MEGDPGIKVARKCVAPKASKGQDTGGDRKSHSVNCSLGQGGGVPQKKSAEKGGKAKERNFDPEDIT